MKRTLRLSLIAICFGTLFTSCDNGAYTATPGQTSNATNPIKSSNNGGSGTTGGNGSTGTTAGTFTAKINGNQFTASMSYYSITSGLLAIYGIANAGTANQTVIDLSILSYNGAGTYDLTGAAAYTVGNSQAHSAASGTLVITSAQNNNMKGTFNFTTSDNYTVSNGAFNVNKQ